MFSMSAIYLAKLSFTESLIVLFGQNTIFVFYDSIR